jgi:hypothetical protein
MIEVRGSAPTTRVEEAVLFAFDEMALPFRLNLVTRLVGGKNRRRPEIVLHKGSSVEHDESLHYYGTTIKVGDEFRMYYNGRIGVNSALANMEGFEGRLCQAISKDGIHWEKPKLGLVEFNGSKENNIVSLPGEPDIMAGVVLYEPEDPDPARRFKLVYESGRDDRHARMCVAFSQDGLNWVQSPNNPVGPRLEMAGCVNFNGCYYVNGQGPGQAGLQRKLHTYASYDFEKWSPASVLGLRRSPILEGPSTDDVTRTGEEVHLGASLHNRGNVILGIYGQWHGHPTGDRRWVTIDLGLLISHDGMHFHEPIRDYKFIVGREEPESTNGWGPALMQGQGMYDMGDETYYWYSLWRHDGQVRLTTWERDRFGYVTPYPPNPVDFRDYSQLVTCPLQSLDGNAQAFLNVAGLGEYAGLRVEALDEKFNPVKGFSGDEAAILRESGLRVPVKWPGGDALPNPGGPVRLSFTWGPIGPGCIRPEDIRLYAVYLR